MKKSLSFYFGMALSLAFLGWAVAKLDFAKAFEAIVNLKPLWLLPFTAAFILPLWLRAVRLQAITLPVKPVSVRTLYASVCIGFMGNMIFPLRIGELIRVYVVAKQERVSQSGILATIIVERIFDIFATALLVVVAVLIATPAEVDLATWEKIKQAALFFGALSLGAGAAVFLLAQEEGPALRWAGRLIRALPAQSAAKLESLFASFRQGLQVMRRGHHFIVTVAYTLVLFAAVIGFYWTALPLFGIAPSWEAALVLTVFALVGVAIPSAPGAVGTYHAGIIFGLSLYGVDANKALGVAIFIHLYMFAFFLATGGYYIWRGKLTMAELRHSADTNDESAALPR